RFPTLPDMSFADAIGLDLDIHWCLKFAGRGDVLHVDVRHRADPDPLQLDGRSDVQPLDGAVEVQHIRPYLRKKWPRPRIKSPTTMSATAPTINAPMTAGFARLPMHRSPCCPRLICLP